MSTPKEQYDAMLDGLDDESKFKLIEHILWDFPRFYEELCPVDYRCGAADFQATCDECHHEFWADDLDAEAVCSDCLSEQIDDEAAEGEDA